VPLEGGARAAADQARRWRAADALIIHGEEPRCFVEASAPGVPVHVVPVDLVLGGPPVPRAQARTDLGLDDVPTALLLGQVRPYKGIGLLAQAWPQVTAALPGARLLVVGEAYDSADLRLLESCPGVEVRPGFVPEGDLDRWAAAADVLVLPYSVGSHSGVLHRGLAAGTPVLASPPLAEEVFRTGAGAVAPLDPGAWAEALVAALGSHPLPRPRPPTGRGTAQGTLAVYRQVLAGRARAVA
jgi:glycosyltransferase involved in cell wall biosynthesis